VKLLHVVALGWGSLAVACQAPARISSRWVFLASGANNGIAVGPADVPVRGGPLSLAPGSPAAGTCLPAQDYDRAFGPLCEHEPEGDTGAAANAVDSTTGPGVRWFCRGDLAVRVVLEQCPDGHRLRVSQLAVATVYPQP
jgi:hypothetical protein